MILSRVDDHHSAAVAETLSELAHYDEKLGDKVFGVHVQSCCCNLERSCQALENEKKIEKCVGNCFSLRLSDVRCSSPCSADTMYIVGVCLPQLCCPVRLKNSVPI